MIKQHVSATNAAGVVLNGYLVRQKMWGGSLLMYVELDGTTSTVEVDRADFDWAYTCAECGAEISECSDPDAH